MELEALLLGLEPIVALGIGIAAIALTPLIGSIINPELGQNLSDSGKNLAKQGIRVGMETYDKIQSGVAEAAESWNDLVAEAQAELELSRNTRQPPRQVEIVQE